MLNISTLLSIRFVHQNSGADQTSIMQCCYRYRKLAPASRIQLHCGLNSNIIFTLPHKRHIRFFLSVKTAFLPLVLQLCMLSWSICNNPAFSLPLDPERVWKSFCLSEKSCYLSCWFELAKLCFVLCLIFTSFYSECVRCRFYLLKKMFRQMLDWKILNIMIATILWLQNYPIYRNSTVKIHMAIL